MQEQPLKLLALDAEDLAILSAHLQDAVTRVGDIAYLPSERRFALAASRFDWLSAVEGKGNRRRRSAIHFDRVRSVRTKGIDRDKPNACLCLLAISFEEGQSPSGNLQLDFAGGACIKLDVECVEARLSDLGPAWEARCCPEHVEDLEPAGSVEAAHRA